MLGGDDLTILLRADLAVPFAERSLTAFEVASREKLAPLKQEFPVIPEALTAGAGIAFVKSSYPFHLAHELAESLAKHAKTKAKEGLARGARIPPTLAFHRVTTASPADYKDIIDRQMTCGPDDRKVITTLGVYGLDNQPEGLPRRLADLKALAQLLGQEAMARGPARQVLTLLGQDLGDARRRYARWQEVMRERYPKEHAQLLALLKSLCGELDEDLPVTKGGSPQSTPLGDVASLLAVMQGSDAEQDKNTREETR